MPDLLIRHRILQADRVTAVQSFVRVYPNITTDPQRWPDPPLSDADWVKHRVKSWLNDTIRQGRDRKHQEDNPPPAAQDFAETE